MTSLRAGILFSGRGAPDSLLRARRQKFEALAERSQSYRFSFPEDDPRVFLYVNTARQPLVQFHIASDGSFSVIDGEVYNLGEIAPSENGHDRDDARLLLDLYRSQGEALFSRLDAAASIAIWDSRNERLLVHRDRWGAVPSYFKEESSVLCWASNVPTLLQVVGYDGINLPALDCFLGTGHAPAPWTLASGISKLQPAHCLTADRQSSAQTARYWRPTGKPKLELSADETAEQFDFHLKRALKRRVRQSDEVALLLSGGVDSKLLAAALQDIGEPFRSYTFRYAQYEGEFNESGEAEKAARHLGIPFTEIPYEPHDISDNLDWMVKSYGEPFNHGLHSSMVGRLRSEGAKVVINGAGPDGWYLTPWDRLSLMYSKTPNLVQDLAARSIPLLRKLGAATRPNSLARLYAKAGRLAHGAEIIGWGARRRVSPRFIGIWNPAPYRSGLYRDAHWLADGRLQFDEILEQVRQDFRGESERDRIVFMARQLLSAEATFYYSHWWNRGAELQLRTPYLDLDLNEFAMRLPRSDLQKLDLRRVAERYLGRDMAYSPKIGQTVPIQQWFQTSLRDFLIDQLSASRLEASGVFDVEAVQSMIDEHLRGTANHAFHLWPIITVLRWQECAASGDW